MNVISRLLWVIFCLHFAVISVAAEEKTPSAAWFHREGQSYFKKGDNERAVFYWKKELALNPSDPNVLNNIGIAYKRLGSFDEAIGYHNRAIAANPRFGHAYYSLGQALYAKRDCIPASEAFVKAASLKYEVDNSRYSAAMVFIAMRNYPQAVENLEAVLKISPTYPGVNYQLGKCLLRLGEKGKAAAYFVAEAKLRTPAREDALWELREISPLRYQLARLGWGNLAFFGTLILVLGAVSVWLSRKVVKLVIIKREWQAQLLLLCVVLFMPFPMYLIFGAGWAPPASLLGFVLLMAADHIDPVMSLSLGVIFFNLFLIYLYLANRFTALLTETIKSRAVHLVIALLLVGLSFFNIYFIADVGGGRHHYSIISIFSDNLPD